MSPIAHIKFHQKSKPQKPMDVLNLLLVLDKSTTREKGFIFSLSQLLPILCIYWVHRIYTGAAKLWVEIQTFALGLILARLL